MTKEPELFTPLGGVRPLDGFTEAELAQFTPERRADFDALQKAMAGEVRADENLKECQGAVRRAMGAVELARSDLWKLAPRRSFMDEWRTTVKGEAPQFDPDPETAEKIAKCEVALKAAEDELDHARADMQAASMALKPARARVASALQTYIARRERSDVVRDHIGNEQKRRADNIAEGRRPEQNRPQRRQHASVLDAARAGGRGPAGFNAKVGARPGTYPAHARGMKLPSQR